jgi:steroid 5-alpha reductase family enzyme
MSEKSRGILWTVAAYASAVLVGGAAVVGAHHALGLPETHAELWAAALADLAATATVFGFSVGTRNHSMYDPYWSVAPPLLLLFWASTGPGLTPSTALWLLLVTAWSCRLTWNFYRGWPGIHRQDWRYDQLKRQTGRAFLLVSAGGIHVLPTVLVFAGCLPLYALVTRPAPTQIGAAEIAAGLFTAVFIGIELIADEQLHAFVKAGNPKGTILNQGLWRFSRHPNYFGEMGMWWGLALGAWAAGAASWWTWVGAVAITTLFLLGSIPLLDRRSLERRPGYAQHMQRVSSVIPWFPRR